MSGPSAMRPTRRVRLSPERPSSSTSALKIRRGWPPTQRPMTRRWFTFGEYGIRSGILCGDYQRLLRSESEMEHNPDRWKAMQAKLVAEALGTFLLVFAGTGAIVVNSVHTDAVSHVGVAITFGLVVMTMIYAFGDISGAHLNPAVTAGFWLAGRLPTKQVLPYIAAQ